MPSSVSVSTRAALDAAISWAVRVAAVRVAACGVLLLVTGVQPALAHVPETAQADAPPTTAWADTTLTDAAQIDLPLTPRAIAFQLRYGSAPGAHLPPSPSSVLPPDRWWAMDKAKHLGGSMLWTLSTQYVLVAKAGWSEGDALPASVASAATIGLAKEVYDRHFGPPPRYFSGKDLVADGVGILLGVGVILL